MGFRPSAQGAGANGPTAAHGLNEIRARCGAAADGAASDVSPSGLQVICWRAPAAYAAGY